MGCAHGSSQRQDCAAPRADADSFSPEVEAPAESSKEEPSPVSELKHPPPQPQLRQQLSLERTGVESVTSITGSTNSAASRRGRRRNTITQGLGELRKALTSALTGGRSKANAELQEKCTVCGFLTLKDPVTISVEAQNVAAFSLPQEVLSFDPPADIVVSKFANGDEERKIHCNIELRQDERDKLAELQRLAAEREVVLSPVIAVQATRYISANKNDIELALESMRRTHEWRTTYFSKGPISDATIAQDLALGAVYFVGRDRALRPTLVIRVARMQHWLTEKDGQKLIQVVVFCLEYFMRYMVCPGRVESINVLVDLRDVAFSSINRHALGEVNKVLSNHFRMRVFRIYICNAPTLISALAGAVKRMLTDRQQQKLTFVKKFEELHEEFAYHQLEEDFGGTMPNVQTFFPFPLQAGPFDAGSRTGPRPDAVVDLHRAVTALGLRGRLWNGELSQEENRTLEYTHVAEEMLRACGLPAPPAFAVVQGSAERQRSRSKESIPEGVTAC